MQDKEENNWETTTNRFVAFFDIMGFKDLVLKTKHQDIVDLLEALSKARTTLDQVNNTKIGAAKLVRGETKSFTFSDSIIFFSKGDSEGDANKITLDCLYLQKVALEKQIPIKGAIAYGEITVDHKNSIYFGQPIIDAYLLHEDLHMFTVIADYQFEKKAISNNLGGTKTVFEFYKTPLKSGKANHYILKPIPKNIDSTLENLNKLYHSVSGKPRQYIDNTIEFYNTIKAKKTSTK